MLRLSLFGLSAFIVFHVESGPTVDVASLAPNCLFPSLVCNDDGLQKRTSLARCLNISEICNGVRDCQQNDDEAACDGQGYVVSSLASDKDNIQGSVISNINEFACAKLCNEVNNFQCMGFQHNNESRKCRLLYGTFSKKISESSTHGPWKTFQKEINTINTVSLLNSESYLSENQKDKLKAVIDGIKASSVELDLNVLSAEQKREKRQSISFLPHIFSVVSNIFSGKFPERSFPVTREQVIFESLSKSCGTRSINFEPPPMQNGRNGRIINGVTAPAGAVPWMAAIKLKDGDSFRQLCGGAIISDRFVLTAAHCVDHLRHSEFVVVVGIHDEGNVGSEQQMFEVERFANHFNFNYKNNKNDISLIKLKTVNGQGIVFGNEVQPICLPTTESPQHSSMMCSVSGWGLQKPGDMKSQSSSLKVAAVPLLPTETCNRKDVYGDQNKGITDGRQICAGYLDGGIDSCKGDSGGPLACNVDGQFQLFGLVSWGDGCAAKNKPGVYTNVYYYLNWIHEMSRKL